MHIVVSQETVREDGFSSPDFRHVRNSLTYEDMHLVRVEVSEFLQSRRITETHIGNLLLALTEILSNLVKHPERKADYVEIQVSHAEGRVTLKVLDNSTPFANFNAKCESSLSNRSDAMLGDECGYGLGCILKLYRDVQYQPRQEEGGFNCFTVSGTLDAVASTLDSPRVREKKRVFLVDDDPISLMIHQSMLEEVYDVISFQTAPEALEAFVSERPDVVISDLSMPGMDGIALREALSDIDGGDITPFIFLSGYAEKQEMHHINQLGVDDLLCKPVTADRLHTVLTRLLRRSQQIRSSVQGQFNQDITELLRPVMPKHYGAWAFQSRHQVAEAGGGDFILHHETSESMMAVIADVMGHGRQAKFFSYVYAGYLHSVFRMTAEFLDAGSFLQMLSTSIDSDPLLENMVMTCQCLQFFENGSMKVASAGHPRPILIRAGVAGFVNVAGLLPGLAGDGVYDVQSLRLHPGDKVLFMTDGFLEAFDRRGRAPLELRAVVQSLADRSRGDVMEGLWQAFEEKKEKYTGSEDDATIVLAEYGAEQ